MLRRLRKSSGQVTLVLIGVAALAGCGEQKRDMYATREDCLADWGHKPEDCTPSGTGRAGGGGVYYGPSYSVPWWRSASSSHASGSTPHAVSSVSAGSVSRGGFGASARSSAG
jgi:uncharacterized protein YgiB involved in biofilm formation